MANGTTALALSRMALEKKAGGAEHEEIMKISAKGKLPKISMKYPSEHNHSK